MNTSNAGTATRAILRPKHGTEPKEVTEATLTKDEIESYGQQVFDHLEHAKKYDLKSEEHRRSAAKLLIAVKAALPHGEYGKWLEAHRISTSAAQRLVDEYKNPEALEQRQQYDRKRKAAERAAANLGRQIGEAAAKNPGSGKSASCKPSPPSSNQRVSVAGERIKRLVDEHPDSAVWDSALTFIEAELPKYEVRH